MALKTVDVDRLAQQTGSLYEAVAVLAKRARQVATTMKAELDEKLSYFEGFDSDYDDPRHREDQAKISVEYEKKPEATEVALDEMLRNELFYRAPTENAE